MHSKEGVGSKAAGEKLKNFQRNRRLGEVVILKEIVGSNAASEKLKIKLLKKRRLCEVQVPWCTCEINL